MPTKDPEKLKAQRRRTHLNMSPEQKLKKKIRHKEWVNKNKDKLNARARENRKKDYMIEYNKNYRAKNREKLIAEGKKYYRDNREAALERARNWRESHKEERRVLAANIRKRNTTWINEYKKDKTCSRCTENYPQCLEFHHPNDDKEFHISKRCGYSIERIKREIAKCVLLCANCHRKEHYKNEA